MHVGTLHNSGLIPAPQNAENSSYALCMSLPNICQLLQFTSFFSGAMPLDPICVNSSDSQGG
jgi:hypothetical protein